jgi:hypothetical protein
MVRGRKCNGKRAQAKPVAAGHSAERRVIPAGRERGETRVQSFLSMLRVLPPIMVTNMS